MTSAIVYKSFGDPIKGYNKPPISSVVKKIIVIALAILVGGALGALGGPLGILVGASVVATTVLLFISIDRIRSRILAHRFQVTLPYIPVAPEAPPLGKYTPTDIKVVTRVEESLEWKMHLLSLAQQSIELSANFAGGESFRQVLAVIENTMEERPLVKAHLIISRDLLEKKDINRLKELRDKFGDRFHYLITDRILRTEPFVQTEENHFKALVVDGNHFVMGGTGISPKMSRSVPPERADRHEPLGAALLDEAFCDTDVVGRGPLALTVRHEFYNLLEKWERRMKGESKSRFFPLSATAAVAESPKLSADPSLHRGVKTRLIVAGPEHRTNNPITVTIAKFIKRAREDVRLASLYFNLPRRIRKALRSTRARVKVYVNKPNSATHVFYALISRRNYHFATQVFEYSKDRTLYHKKVTTVDGKYVIIGSYNLGDKSSVSDDEGVLVIKDRGVASEMNAMLDEDEANSAESSRSPSLLWRVGGAFTRAILAPLMG